MKSILKYIDRHFLFLDNWHFLWFNAQMYHCKSYFPLLTVVVFLRGSFPWNMILYYFLALSNFWTFKYSSRLVYFAHFLLCSKLLQIYSKPSQSWITTFTFREESHTMATLIATNKIRLIQSSVLETKRTTMFHFYKAIFSFLPPPNSRRHLTETAWMKSHYLVFLLQLSQLSPATILFTCTILCCCLSYIWWVVLPLWNRENHSM